MTEDDFLQAIASDPGSAAAATSDSASVCARTEPERPAQAPFRNWAPGPEPLTLPSGGVQGVR